MDGWFAWDRIDYVFGKIAMGIKQSHTATAHYVLQNARFEKRRFAASRLSNHIDMPPTIRFRQAQKRPFNARIQIAKM